MRPLRQHLTYGNVMATIAVFIALGGSAAAATSLIVSGANIRNNTVTGADLKNATITRADVSAAMWTRLQRVGQGDLNADVVGTTNIADGAVTSADLADGGVGSVDLADGGITSGDIGDGQVGSADLAAGSVGTSQLAANVSGRLGNDVVDAWKSGTLASGAGQKLSLTAQCPDGRQAIAGGYLTDNGDGDALPRNISVYSSRIGFAGDWGIKVRNNEAAGPVPVSVFAVCMADVRWGEPVAG